MTAARAGRAGLLLAACTAILLWPAYVSGAPWAFPDSRSYYASGSIVLGSLVEWLGLEEPRRDAEPLYRSLRSVPFSVFLNASIRVVGLWAPIVAMTAAVAGVVLLALRDLPARAQLGVVSVLAAATALPFFAVLLQPDLLTALVVLIPLVAMLQADRLGPGALAALFGLMAAATMTHYGNLPLAMLAAAWLAGWAVLRRRGRIAALALLPVAATVAVNLAVGLFVQNGLSLTPGRIPFLLARSIEDGPGLEYLQARCPEADYAICALYDEIPENVGAFLWGPEGLAARATPDQLRDIAAEELPLMIEILRYDAPGQIGAFARNAVRQFFLFDTAEGTPMRYELGHTRLGASPIALPWTPREPAVAQAVLVGLGALVLLWAAWRPPHPEARAAIAFLLLSLVAYAALCGGLSAPAPRYQARLVWLVPLLAAMLWAHGRKAPA